MADRAAERMEPDSMGALRSLIKLNRAIAGINLGSLTRARERLEEVVSVYSDGSEVNSIARGYIAVIDHVRGNFEPSLETYTEVIERLRRDGHSRAASIFSRHKADLLRRKGSFTEARGAASDAIQLAVSGTHEDVRNLALLAEMRIKLKDKGYAGNERIMADLDSIEDYARIMNVPLILAEVDELRGRFHMASGDLSAAGSFAAQALALAATHELKLRKASSLGLIAEVHLLMGFADDCAAELEELKVLARQIDYHAMSSKAQELSSRIAGRNTSGNTSPV